MKVNFNGISSMYYHFPDIFYDDFKQSCSHYIKLIKPSKNTMKSIMEEENHVNDGDRAIKKSNNHFELGEIFTELVKKGPPYGTISCLILSNVATDYNLEPDSNLIKDVYKVY